MIVHIVMFKFKEENKAFNIKMISKMLHDLVGSISELKSMEVGVDFNQSERAFDLSLYSTFESKEDLKAYAIHPAHQEVVRSIKCVTDESKVVDYVLK